MNREIKRQWLIDLNSGQYPQGRGALKNEDGYCCFGVLCERAREAGIVRLEETTDDCGRTTWTYVSVTDPGDRSWTYPPEVVVQWAGLGSFNPELPEGYLANLNDEGRPFSYIADRIEGHL